MYSISLDSNFDYCCRYIDQALVDKKIKFSQYGSKVQTMLGTVRDYSICNVGREADDNGNMTLTLFYSILDVVQGTAAYFDKQRTLNIFSSFGDSDWSHVMVEKVFDGKKPSAVAYDTFSGDVFLVYVTFSDLEFQQFGILSKENMELLAEDLNVKEPYSIRIKPKAMFDVLGGYEGINHLKQNLYIAINCTKFNIKVEPELSDVIC